MKRARIGEVETEIETNNNNQAKVIAKLKIVLNFLEGVRINEDSIAKIAKPVDELLSSLKHFPTDEHFSFLPSEIKTDILSYLCDNGAFVTASVCREWRDILEPRLVKLQIVSIGNRCTNKYPCEDGACFMSEEVLKASIAMKMDVMLSICYPVTQLDTNLLVEGVRSVSKIGIVGWCQDETYEVGPTLTNNQIEHLFEGLEQNVENVNYLDLNSVVMTQLDQNRLLNFLLKIKGLRLREGHHKMLDIKMFIEKLLQDSTNVRLSQLYLSHLDFPLDLSVDMANALCKIESVKLNISFPHNVAVIKQLIANILTRNVTIKRIKILRNYDWTQLVNSKDLKTMISKMKVLLLMGEFTLEQIEGGIEIKNCVDGFKILFGFEEVAKNRYRKKPAKLI